MSVKDVNICPLWHSIGCEPKFNSTGHKYYDCSKTRWDSNNEQYYCSCGITCKKNDNCCDDYYETCGHYCPLLDLAQIHNPSVNVACVERTAMYQTLSCSDKIGTFLSIKSGTNGPRSDEELLKWVDGPECNGRNGGICLNLESL